MEKNYKINRKIDTDNIIFQSTSNQDNYNPLRDAEKIHRFLETLPTLTIDALRRDLLRNTGLNELEIYINQRKESESYAEAYENLLKAPNNA